MESNQLGKIVILVLLSLNLVSALKVDIPVPINYTEIIINYSSNNSVFWNGHEFIIGSISSIETDPNAYNGTLAYNSSLFNYRGLDNGTFTILVNATNVTAPSGIFSTIYSLTNLLSIDVTNRLLYDLASKLSVDYNDRKLYANDGSSYILDWNTKGLANFGSNNITTTGNVTSNYFIGNGSTLTDVCLSNGSQCEGVNGMNYSQLALKNNTNNFTIAQSIYGQLNVTNGNVYVQKTGANAGFIVDRADGQACYMSVGTVGTNFFSPTTFEVAYQTIANVKLGVAAGATKYFGINLTSGRSCFGINCLVVMSYNLPAVLYVIGDFEVTKNASFDANVSILGNLNVTRNTNITGNLSVKMPHAMFSDNHTQPVAATGTAYPMNFSITENNYQIYMASDNRNVTFAQTGMYLIELSIMGVSSVANTHLEVWIQKNGVNVERSNTRYEFKGVNAEAVLAVPFIVEMNTTDKLRVMYAGDNTGVSLPYTLGTAYSPDTPSTIMTITKISEVV